MSDEIKDELKGIRSDLMEHYNDDMKRLGVIEKCIIRIEEDIKHHIERTDRLQNMVEPTYKAYIGIKWLIAAIITAGAIVAAFAKF